MAVDSEFTGFRTYVVDDWEYLMHYFEAALVDSGTAPAVADQFTAFVADHAARGFEFVRCDGVPYRVTPGCLAGLLGAKESYGHRTIVTFRRQTKAPELTPPIAVPAMAEPPMGAPAIAASAMVAPPNAPAPQPQAFQPPAPDQSQTNRTPLLIGGVLVTVLVLGGALLSTSRNSPKAPVVAPSAPAFQQSVAPVVAVPTFAAIPISPDWFLKGGEISGGFVPPEARLDWPEWMQAMVGDKAGVPPAELAKADFYRIPDASLAHAVGVLVRERVFTPDLLKQISAISYAADTGGWLSARGEYQRAYLQANPLPVEDPATCSMVLTSLVRAKEYDTAREALQRGGVPTDPELRASWLRMLDLAASAAKPDPRLIGEPTLPPAERYAALVALDKKDNGSTLLASFRGTPFFSEAVYLGVGRGWVKVTDPLVDESIAQDPPQRDDAPWFLARPGERASDLLWLQATDAVANDQLERAAGLSQELLKRFPQSYFAGHAMFMAEALGQPDTEARPRLKVPSDLNLYNVAHLAPRPAASDLWPAPYDAMAARGRFDLILAQTDPQNPADGLLHGGGTLRPGRLGFPLPGHRETVLHGKRELSVPHGPCARGSPGHQGGRTPRPFGAGLHPVRDQVREPIPAHSLIRRQRNGDDAVAEAHFPVADGAYRRYPRSTH